MKNLLVIAPAVAISFAIVLGCAGKRLPDFCPGSIPQPVGTHVRQWNCEQENKADGERHSIFLGDWSNGLQATAQLAPAAEMQLVRLLARSNEAPLPEIRIVSSGDSVLDQQRQSSVAEFLAMRGVAADTLSHLIIVDDLGSGLRGGEALEVNDTRQYVDQSVLEYRLTPRTTTGLQVSPSSGGGFPGGY